MPRGVCGHVSKPCLNMYFSGYRLVTHCTLGRTQHRAPLTPDTSSDLSLSIYIYICIIYIYIYMYSPARNHPVGAKDYTPESTEVKFRRKTPLRFHWSTPVEVHWKGDRPFEDAKVKFRRKMPLKVRWKVPLRIHDAF